MSPLAFLIIFLPIFSISELFIFYFLLFDDRNYCSISHDSEVWSPGGRARLYIEKNEIDETQLSNFNLLPAVFFFGRVLPEVPCGHPEATSPLQQQIHTRHGRNWILRSTWLSSFSLFLLIKVAVMVSSAVRMQGFYFPNKDREINLLLAKPRLACKHVPGNLPGE